MTPDLLGDEVKERAAFSSHDRSPDGKEEWLTPPHVLKALGPFDLDPCAPIVRPWDTAAKHFTIMDNGLTKPWEGRVWLNPPYGNEMPKWIARLADHGRGTSLLFARTETDAFFEAIWYKATAMLFLRGRLTYYHVNGKPADYNAGAPSVLIAYGEDDAEKLRVCGLKGRFIRLDAAPQASSSNGAIEACHPPAAAAPCDCYRTAHRDTDMCLCGHPFGAHTADAIRAGIFNT
jgi:hypothetical protein